MLQYDVGSMLTRFRHRGLQKKSLLAKEITHPESSWTESKQNPINPKPQNPHARASAAKFQRTSPPARAWPAPVTMSEASSDRRFVKLCNWKRWDDGRVPVLFRRVVKGNVGAVQSVAAPSMSYPPSMGVICGYPVLQRGGLESTCIRKFARSTGSTTTAGTLMFSAKVREPQVLTRSSWVGEWVGDGLFHNVVM